MLSLMTVGAHALTLALSQGERGHPDLRFATFGVQQVARRRVVEVGPWRR
jgi:hypothetical protein